MFTCSALEASVASKPIDPRLTDEVLKCIPGDGEAGTVLLVGVVHDHPASTFRVARILDIVTPDILALELPPLAVPLFKLYARDVYTPPRLGGEMSMAIQAGATVEVVGIDGPNLLYLRTIVKNLSSRDVSIMATARVLKDIASSYKHALACRLAAFVGAVTPFRARVYSHIEYDCTLLDRPTVQATHEAKHLPQQRAFLRAVKLPSSTQLIDRAREESMAMQLRALRQNGDVVTIVGMEHLEELATRLAQPTERSAG